MAPPYHEVLKPVFKHIMATCEGGFAAMGDIVATTAMCFTFVESVMYTRRLSSVVKLLLIYTINRGVLVTTVQILIVALFWYAPIHMCLGKLYVNTLRELNSRQRLRSKSVLMRNEIRITQNNSKTVFNQTIRLHGKYSIDWHLNQPHLRHTIHSSQERRL
ncbi:hypothetical protein BD410DRAFT_795291 [Rickenella mellea]|uniref:DUF6534 domain-containing protein n=1 Tax=Rickenella mellea TaxID=50990 RepID=A0A4Y7PNB7_9AGAM|nr:hypothetical protein BD410DRAFT_795291 [Rickenella mellea]